MHHYFFSPRAAPHQAPLCLSGRLQAGSSTVKHERLQGDGRPTPGLCPSTTAPDDDVPPSPCHALGHRYKWHRDEGCGGQGGVSHLHTAQAGAQLCGVKCGCCRKALLGAELAAMVRSCLTASPCEAQTPTSLQGESLRDLQLHFLTSLMR